MALYAVCLNLKLFDMFVMKDNIYGIFVKHKLISKTVGISTCEVLSSSLSW